MKFPDPINSVDLEGLAEEFELHWFHPAVSDEFAVSLSWAGSDLVTAVAFQLDTPITLTDINALVCDMAAAFTEHFKSFTHSRELAIHPKMLDTENIILSGVEGKNSEPAFIAMFSISTLLLN